MYHLENSIYRYVFVTKLRKRQGIKYWNKQLHKDQHAYTHAYAQFSFIFFYYSINVIVECICRGAAHRYNRRGKNPVGSKLLKHIVKLALIIIIAEELV